MSEEQTAKRSAPKWRPSPPRRSARQKTAAGAERSFRIVSVADTAVWFPMLKRAK